MEAWIVRFVGGGEKHAENTDIACHWPLERHFWLTCAFLAWRRNRAQERQDVLKMTLTG